MKKTRPSPPLILAVFVVCSLVLWSQDAPAKSKNGNLEKSSDVLCGTGGRSQSPSFIVRASAGGQGSPVGPHSSANFSGGAGWAYTIVPAFAPGDANGDGVTDLGDAIFLLNYLFKGGSPPDPIAAGDANCDQTIELGDAIFLLNYLFKNGEAPGCG